MLRLFIISLFFLTNLLSETNENNSSTKTETSKTTLNKEPSLYDTLLSLDYIQSNVSKKILIFSSNLDHSLSHNEENISKASREASATYGIVNFYNDFFKDETFLSSTNKSYIRLKWGVELNSEEGFSKFNGIRINLRLPKTQKALYFFVGDESDNETDTIEDTTSIGIKYVLKNLDILNVSISGGIRGITNPYTRLRFEYPIAFKYLLFRPIQYVEYSYKDEFKEDTHLYFDHRLKNKIDLVRLSFSRYTKTRFKGMGYSTQLSYIGTLKHSIGYQIYTSAQGQTKVQTKIPANTKYNVVPTKGFYNYSTGIVWRQNLFKEYLFYQLQPFVEFDQKYNYNPNYVLRAHIELFFGKVRKR